MVDVSDTVLTAAKKKLHDLTGNWSGGVCHGAVLYLDGSTVNAAHTACHAWVTSAFRTACRVGSTFDFAYTKYPDGAKDFMVLTCHSKKRSSASAEATDAIILWMASDDCPFSKFILNRDDKDSLTNDGAIILCGPNGASLSEAMWMCKVLRYTTEGSKALDTWLTLYKGGVNPMLAVLICTHISSIKGATFGYAPVSSHVTVFNRPGNDDTDLQNLMLGNSNPKANDTSSLFIGTEKKPAKAKKAVDVTTKIKSFCKPFKKSDGWGGTISGDGADASDLVDRVLAWQAELGDGLQPVEKAPPPMPTDSTVYLELDL